MIDYFSLALMHGLLLIGLLRILKRDELDHEDVMTLAEADAAADAKAAIEDEAAPRDARERHRQAKRAVRDGGKRA